MVQTMILVHTRIVEAQVPVDSCNNNAERSGHVGDIADAKAFGLLGCKLDGAAVSGVVRPVPDG